MPKYYSKTYRGFLIQQTELGWTIPLLPEWTKFGPVSKPPFSTLQICQHLIDRILDGG